MPRVHQTAGDVGAGRHQEAREIRDTLVLKNVNGRQYDHADQRQRQREDDVVRSFSKVIRGLCNTQQNHEPDAIGCDGPQVGLDHGVAQSLDDLG